MFCRNNQRWFARELQVSIASRTIISYKLRYVSPDFSTRDFRHYSTFLVYPRPARNSLIRAPPFGLDTCPWNNFVDDKNWNESRSYAYTRHRTPRNWHEFRAVKFACFICRSVATEDKWFSRMPAKEMIRQKVWERKGGRKERCMSERLLIRI